MSRRNQIPPRRGLSDQFAMHWVQKATFNQRRFRIVIEIFQCMISNERKTLGVVFIVTLQTRCTIHHEHIKFAENLKTREPTFYCYPQWTFEVYSCCASVPTERVELPLFKTLFALLLQVNWGWQRQCVCVSSSNSSSARW